MGVSTLYILDNINTSGRQELLHALLWELHIASSLVQQTANRWESSINCHRWGREGLTTHILRLPPAAWHLHMAGPSNTHTHTRTHNPQALFLSANSTSASVICKSYQNRHMGLRFLTWIIVPILWHSSQTICLGKETIICSKCILSLVSAFTSPYAIYNTNRLQFSNTCKYINTVIIFQSSYLHWLYFMYNHRTIWY